MLTGHYTSHFILHDENGQITQMSDQAGYFPNIEEIHELQRFLQKSLENYHLTERHNAYMDHCWSNQLNPDTGKPFPSQKQQKDGTPGFVYIIKDTALDYLKIGYSKNPKHREATLQAEKPTLELVHYIPGSIQLERRIHQRLSEHRVRGEWFNIPVDRAISVLNSYTKTPF